MSRLLLLLVIVLGFSAEALAHHPLAGLPMTTFGQGVLSGIGHPVIGIDHLFFVIAVGVAARYAKSALMSPLFYLAGMLIGTGVIMSGVQLMYVELIIACSVILLGAIVLSGKSLTIAQARVLFTILGIFHGYAFGESVVGGEALSSQVLLGYLVGLCVVQWLVAALAGYFTSSAGRFADSTELRPRLVGAVALGVGISFLVEITESMLLAV